MVTILFLHFIMILIALLDLHTTTHFHSASIVFVCRCFDHSIGERKFLIYRFVEFFVMLRMRISDGDGGTGSWDTRGRRPPASL